MVTNLKSCCHIMKVTSSVAVNWEHKYVYPLVIRGYNDPEFDDKYKPRTEGMLLWFGLQVVVAWATTGAFVFLQFDNLSVLPVTVCVLSMASYLLFSCDVLSISPGRRPWEHSSHQQRGAGASQGGRASKNDGAESPGH